MNKIKYILVALAIIAAFSSRAQNVINGKILDIESGEPIKNAHIEILETAKVLVTNDKGEFKISNSKLPLKVFCSHISYRNQNFIINNSNPILKMEFDNINLNTVDVKPNIPINIIKETKLYVYDYDLKGDSIILLAYQNRKSNQAKILIINSKGDTIKSKALSSMDGLYRDCFENHHLFIKEYAYQIYSSDARINLIHPILKDSLLKSFDPIIEKNDNFYYIRFNSFNNQKISFLIYNSLDSSFKLLYEYADKAGLNMLKDKARLQSAKNYTEADARFEEMCFYSEKHIPLISLNNKVYIFNYHTDSLLCFSKDGNFENAKYINFHHSENWIDELLVDRGNNKVYSLNKKGSISYLKEINIEEGKISSYSIKIPEKDHIQKIKIRNDKVYFLHNDLSNNNYKQLFCMRL
jgi:uncharacterized protein YcfL